MSQQSSNSLTGHHKDTILRRLKYQPESGRRKSFPATIPVLLVTLLGLIFAATTARATETLEDRIGREDAFFRDQKDLPQSLSPEIRELKFGSAFARKVNSGETHRYRISLKAGQYINLLVEQQTMDVEVKAFDPAGTVIAGINWEYNGASESLWLLAAATGDYEVRIIARAIDRSDKQYTIKLEKLDEFQNAPSADQLYVKAHGLFWEASECLTQDNTQTFRQAVEKFQAALPLWRTLNDRVGEAYTRHELGYVYDKLSEQQKSLDSYTEALQIWRRVENHKGEEATTLYNMGSIFSTLGKTAEAIEFYEKAIEIRHLLGDQMSEAYALTNLGQVYINLGEFQAALNAHQEALCLRRGIGDIEGEARSLSNISGVYFSLGEFQEALNYCKQALPLRQAAGDQRGEAITLTNIGSIYRELGEPQKALEYQHRALQLMSRLNNPYNEAAALGAIGRSYYDVGNYAKALEYHDQSLAIRRKIKNVYGQGAALADMGSAYARLGERQKALDCFEQSLELCRATGDRRGEALTLQGAGELYQELGESQKARDYFTQGLALSRTIKNRFFEANLLYHIARLEQRAGRFVEARSQIETAIAIIESTRAKVASTDLRASFLASKQDFYELEIDLLMQSCRRDQNQESLIKAFQVSEQRRARSLLDNLGEARANIRRGVPAELLARERALQAKLNQKAENQIKLLSGRHTPDQAVALAKELETITTDYEQALAEIRSSSPRYAALTQPSPFGLTEIQTEVLDRDTLLLEYALGTERSYLWAVTATTINAVQLPPRATIETLARRVYDLMTSRNQLVKFEETHERQRRIARADAKYEQAAGELSRMLLGPVASQLHKKRLLIVGDGALQYLSFAALPLPVAPAQTGERYAYSPLITEHEVISLPSASTLAVLRREVAGRQPAPKMVAVLADPVFDKGDKRVKPTGGERKPDPQPLRENQAQPDDETQGSEFTRLPTALGWVGIQLRFPRLPFTMQEAKAITALTNPGESKTITGFSANRATAMGTEMSLYRYLHFATHGLLNNRHPELSGIVLSLVDEEGREKNGFLLTNEIYNLHLPAELIVLSGCRTGLGKELRGEGILSLTHAFMYAGTPRVLVSLWDVSDESTAELMTHFYKAMLGERRLSPAAALRQAQLSMLKSVRWRMPYYWAAFVLQGEYR